MDKKTLECIELLRTLVSDIQGAPYPGEEVNPKLYSIWYEHVQRDAVNAFEFLDENFPDKKEISKTIDKLFK
ncbi:MAG: hypothetical protein MJ169_08835 [Treponema sp.]|nr:hypothetical protein [Treponema sp.]